MASSPLILMYCDHREALPTVGVATVEDKQMLGWLETSDYVERIFQHGGSKAPWHTLRKGGS